MGMDVAFLRREVYEFSSQTARVLVMMRKRVVSREKLDRFCG